MLMFTNFIKTAWRNITRNKIYFLINTAGLAIGIAVCILILQYVNFELSFDQFNKNADDLYRVVNDRYQDGKLVQRSTMTYPAIGKAMQNDYPEVINHTRVAPQGVNKSNAESNGIEPSPLFTRSILAGCRSKPISAYSPMIYRSRQLHCAF